MLGLVNVARRAVNSELNHHRQLLPLSFIDYLHGNVLLDSIRRVFDPLIWLNFVSFFLGIEIKPEGNVVDLIVELFNERVDSNLRIVSF